MSVTRGDENVYKDLGFDVEEAEGLKIRADLMLNVRKYIEERGWTQAQAAEFFDETQLRISNLMNGDISHFSIDRLVSMLARAGMQVRLQVESKAA
ncbi:MAG: helix-turn-helix domain-containing protein [Deinococcota bacterium]|jgi:predicted XRE-type DNA-binding protein|nr:helix-turn-helix domain-containing protein [Deinococcota bacterium]